MRNSPSIPGLSGGRPHGRRDMAKDDRTIELRPVSSSSSESDDEETNRKLSDEVTQRSSLGHKRPTRDSISSYNKYCRPYLCSFRRSSHSNRQKLQSLTIPLSFEAPAKRNPCEYSHIGPYLIFPQTRVIGLHFCRCKYGYTFIQICV